MTAPTEQRTTVTLSPLREGANIGTWIGFKHFMYLAEAAVLAWFSERGIGAAALYRDHGLRLTVVESSVLLPAVLEADDVVDAEVTGGPRKFTVRLIARRPGAPAVLRGRLTVALIARPGSLPSALPGELAPLVAGEVAELALAERADLAAGTAAHPGQILAQAGSGAFLWTWRVPYYYCEYSDQLQLSGYVRALEEVVDRFLASRGLSIATMLRDRGWIPVVSRARITMLAATSMEDTMHTVFTVDDVLKRSSFDGRMDCYVQRGGIFAHTATARILHGYAIARGPGAGQLAELDDATISVLLAR
jgi:acyl-CoA thioesterase FadM